MVEGMRYLRDWRTSVLISSVLMGGGAVPMCDGAVLMSGGAVLMCGGAIMMCSGAVLMSDGAVLMCSGAVLIFRRYRSALGGREIRGRSVLR